MMMMMMMMMMMTMMSDGGDGPVHDNIICAFPLYRHRVSVPMMGDVTHSSAAVGTMGPPACLPVGTMGPPAVGRGSKHGRHAGNAVQSWPSGGLLAGLRHVSPHGGAARHRDQPAPRTSRPRSRRCRGSSSRWRQRRRCHRRHPGQVAAAALVCGGAGVAASPSPAGGACVLSVTVRARAWAAAAAAAARSVFGLWPGSSCLWMMVVCIIIHHITSRCVLSLRAYGWP
jgi:hypothetical protein